MSLCEPWGAGRYSRGSLLPSGHVQLSRCKKSRRQHLHPPARYKPTQGSQTPHGFTPLLTAAPGQRTTTPRNGPRAPEGSGGASRFPPARRPLPPARPPTGPRHTGPGARVGVKWLTLRRHNHRALPPVGKEERKGGRKASERPSGAQGRASPPFYLSRCVKRWRPHRRPPQAPLATSG